MVLPAWPNFGWKLPEVICDPDGFWYTRGWRDNLAGVQHTSKIKQIPAYLRGWRDADNRKQLGRKP